MAIATLHLQDLDHCFHGVGIEQWERLRGARLFVTGATGIIGKWLLQTAAEADRRLALGLEIVALSRDPARFAAEEPGLASMDCLKIVRGDVRTFEAPAGQFDFVVHAATDVVAPGGPLDVFDTCAEGTRAVLDFAVNAGATNFLLLSSGAIYGPQPSDLEFMPEHFSGGPDLKLPSSAYGEGKRVSEWLAGAYARDHGLKIAIARIYALVGPYLPLDKHFAIGNFIRDAMAGRPIVIRGWGTEIRSYLYLADVTVWLWSVLFYQGDEFVFNVGSSEAVSLLDLAYRVNKVLGNPSGVQIEGRGENSGVRDRYVPSTELARTTLAVKAHFGLDEAISMTARWSSLRKL